MSDSHDSDPLGSGTPVASVDEGRSYWRSLEQLAQTDDYRRFADNEFPAGPDAPADDVSRRGFIGVVAAAVAMASTTACRKPVRKILPHAKRPEDTVVGLPSYYATTLTLGGYGTGVLARSSDGRPTKIEGNHLHPASLGGSDLYGQADVLNLYDPARSKHVWYRGQSRSDSGEPLRAAAFEAEWRNLSRSVGNGANTAVLMAPATSPTLRSMLDELRAKYSGLTVASYDPINRDAVLEGSNRAFGMALDAQYDLAAADVVVALDSDLLHHGPNAVRHARDFASRRQPQTAEGAQRLNRLYAVEPTMSVTGGQAEHRFAVRPSQVAEVAFALAAELNLLSGPLSEAVNAHKGHGFNTSKGVNWVAAIAKDLLAARGRSVIVAGARQPAAVHAVVHALNAALDNVGKTVSYKETPASLAQGQTAGLRDLIGRMNAGQISTLFILGCNPVYDAPADLDFAAALAKVETSVHYGLYRDETGRECTWHLNATHELEAWGDALAYDGTASIQQPSIAPLYGAMSPIELIALLAGSDEREGHELVRYYWEDVARAEDFDGWWATALRDGIVADSAPAAVTPPSLQVAGIAEAVRGHAKAGAASASSLEVVFAQSAAVYDGRYANNPWLQECPDPITKLTWDNAAVISPKTAAELGLSDRDVVRIEVGGRDVNAPVWIVPGTADFTVSLALGYGRAVEGQQVSARAGFNAYFVRTTGAMAMANGAKLTPAGRTYALATTQDHGSMEGRPLFREASVSRFQAEPDFAPAMSPQWQAAELVGETEEDRLKSLWEERDYSEGPQWGMVIDLNTCNGCQACVVACQSENNIPSVGKQHVAEGREMHWLRIDRYFSQPEAAEGEAAPAPESVDASDIGAAHQPIPCMQCENAPCESVCPVAATTHSPDGLNDMAYNRCIGTRYCSNNCPYKVRKFNWFDFNKPLEEPTMQMVQNPDVSVRMRGVMEKCTYCVQRITGARNQAKRDGRPLSDGDVVPACGQACPSQAITFGDITDENSAVAGLRRSSLNYGLLAERNLKPRTTFLARVTNPNPELS